VAGPNGFPVEIYQNFWDTIKASIMELFGALHARQLELFKLNSREIILLPKTKEAERIQYYRPMYLLNVRFKIFSKVAAIRLKSMDGHVVWPTQTTFL
jgi:hypothetical protein